MTDDFHLFGDPDDGERPIDPDVALVSAYLAHELSPIQVLALEERLATDAAFRSAMQPLLDAWAAPVASLGGGAARRAPALSERERDASWRRFAGEATPIGSVRQVSPRRTSMKRAAAVIALVVVPMASFAQVVVYAANNPDARGHEIARRIVAPFVREASAPTPGAELPGGTQASPGVPRPREVDTGALLPVPTAPVFPLESESVRPSAPRGAPAAGQTASTLAVPSAATQPAAQARQPNRAQVAAYVRNRHPTVVNGSASAEYVVMVVDAAELYVWSTFGTGNVMTEVAGDTRTAAERDVYTREHRFEFFGDSGVPWGGSVSSVRGVAGGRGGRISGSSGATVTADSMVVGTASGVVGGRRIILDSARTREGIGTASGVVGGRRIMLDSTRTREVTGTAGGTRVRGGVEITDSVRARMVQSAGAGREARGGGSDSGTAEGRRMILSRSGPSVYRHGFMSTRNPPDVNQAEGLVPLENGSSGIEGLPSASVAGSETYVFPPGQLAPTPLRVILVRLTPDAVWSPR